jgi:NADH-quinone oxidoreductase subunit N
VYQGAPTPTLAFLAVGSKAAGFVLLLRVFGEAFPVLAAQWKPLWMAMAAATIMYGNLCALPQRSLKRLLGFSGIANAGYLLLGMAALSREGYAAMLFYLVAYLFAILAAVMVISRLMDENETDDLSVLAGLHQRSPLLAAILAVAMISLAGIPPVAGFFGKFLLLKAVVAKGAEDPSYYWLTATALVGIVISLYYYFGVIRAIYWTRPGNEPAAIPTVSLPARVMLYLCLAGMLIPGILPSLLMHWATQAIAFMP